MRLPLRAALICILLGSTISAQQYVSRTPRELIGRALEKIGGEVRLRSLSAIHLKAYGHRVAREQSERPEGPYIMEYQQLEESRDFKNSRWKLDAEIVYPYGPVFRTSAVLSDSTAMQSFDGTSAPGGGQQLQDADEALSLSLERILLLAADAKDLHSEPHTMLQSSPTSAVGFQWKHSL